MSGSYQSPTTPGLAVNFGQYVVELVCLNMEPNLRARFWLDKKYWGPKYGREMCGFNKFGKLYDDLSLPLRQQAIINAVRHVRNQSLLPTKTLERLDRAVKKEYDRLVAARQKLVEQAPVVRDVDPTDFARENARIVSAPSTSKLDKVRRIEQSGQEVQAKESVGSTVG